MRIYPFFLPHGGCPQRCLFCDQRRVAGEAAAPDPTRVRRDLDAWLPAAGGGEVAFFGGSFTLLPDSLQVEYLAAARDFVQAGRVAGIRLSTRPDALDGAIAERLAEAGVTTVELGCQSLDDGVLHSTRRGHGSAAVKAAVAALRSRGLQVGLQLMPGLPGGSAAEALTSVRKALELHPDFLRLYPTLVLAGTGLAGAWRAGTYRAWSLDEAVEVCADLLLACRRAGTPVIRLGLQGEAGFTRKAGVLAGPWHPAFGQLVRSRLWRRALEGTWPALQERAMVTVARAELSDALGQRRANLEYFSRRGRRLQLVGDPDLPRGSFLRGHHEFSLLGTAGRDGEE